MLLIRSATGSELKTAASWILTARDCQLWAGPRVRFPIELHSLAGAIAFAASNSFALIDRGAFVAFGQLMEKDLRRGHLARLIVAPTLRGKGYGYALVRALIERSRAVGLARVSLNVDGSNGPALSLYSRLGFRDASRPVDEPDSLGSRYMEIDG